MLTDRHTETLFLLPVAMQTKDTAASRYSDTNILLQEDNYEAKKPNKQKSRLKQATLKK